MEGEVGKKTHKKEIDNMTSKVVQKLCSLIFVINSLWKNSPLTAIIFGMMERKRISGFRRIFTVAFSLFLAPAGANFQH